MAQFEDMLSDSTYMITFERVINTMGSYELKNGAMGKIRSKDLMTCVKMCKTQLGSHCTVKIFIHKDEDSYAFVIDNRRDVVCAIARSLKTLKEAIKLEYGVNVVDVS